MQLRAIYRIISFWHRARAQRYMADVQAAFQNVKELPDLGKHVQWPATPSGMGALGAVLRKVHAIWWAKQVLARYDEKQTEELKKKIKAQELLHGRRRFWCVHTTAARV